MWRQYHSGSHIYSQIRNKRIPPFLSNVQKHIKQVHTKKGKTLNHKCEYCDKSFVMEKSLLHHLFRCHRSKLTTKNFQIKQCWACPDCDFITDVVSRYHLERHVKHRHNKQLREIILQDIFTNNLVEKEKIEVKEEYFKPKEETNTETERGPQDLNGQFSQDISDEDSNDDDQMKTSEQNPSYLCPIKSCTFVMSFYVETNKNKHIETQHEDINMTGVSFIKL